MKLLNFQVIAPRLKDCQTSYTVLHFAPREALPGRVTEKQIVLEIRGKYKNLNGTSQALF